MRDEPIEPEPHGVAPLHLRALFPPVDTAAWEAAIQQDLKGADYEMRLVWRPEPGIAVRPYYRRDDLDRLRDGATTSALPGSGASSAGWESVSAWILPDGTIRADDWHDAGATVVQQVGYAIAAGIDRLASSASQAAEQAAMPEFAFAVGSTYFLEIAKLRAARLLWAQACAAFDRDGDAGVMRMHVRTGRGNKSVYDAYTNLLRVTTEAMSAVLGGCDRLMIEPFGFDEHLAETAHHILREEAHLDAVADPAAGSYYLEALTDAVARRAWELMQQIEAEGGFAAAWQSGRVQAAIAASHAEQAKAIASRRRTLVGVNNYPNLTEREPAPAPPPLAATLTAERQAEPFERLRARAVRHARQRGRPPAVLLLVRGDVKMRIARANFCRNLFGCGGFDIRESDGDLPPDIDLVVLCSADAEYLALARDVCPRATVPVLVAGNPAADLEALRQAGVQGFVHAGSNAVETLTAWQERLGIA